MRRFTRWLAVAGCTAIFGAAGALVTPSIAQAQTDNCHDVSVPVTVAAQKLSMHGVLCRAQGDSAHAVQVLVPGATYNHTYWDFPYKPDTYNFRLAMNRAGFDTLTLDRLGTGGSSRPPSATLTSTTQANAVHQVIQALRRGDIDDGRAGKIIIGGHSLGSLITMLEASTYHDVDAVLLTGISHHLGLVGIGKLFATSVRPAMLDPQLSQRRYDPGYLTTVPGTRASGFYSPGKPDPEVVKTDEETKDVVATTEVADGVVSTLTPATRTINVPVLLANGEKDPLVCGVGVDCTTAATLKATEAPYFSPAAHLETFVLPGFGHDINLAPDTGDYQHAVADWAHRVVDGAER